jgi:hypothetical protein
MWIQTQRGLQLDEIFSLFSILYERHKHKEDTEFNSYYSDDRINYVSFKYRELLGHFIDTSCHLSVLSMWHISIYLFRLLQVDTWQYRLWNSWREQITQRAATVAIEWNNPQKGAVSGC